MSFCASGANCCFRIRWGGFHRLALIADANSLSSQARLPDQASPLPVSEEMSMTVDQFAEALRVSEAEDGGLEMPALIEALREQADAMQTCVDE